jgi:opacity protein-like surface antigen
MKKLTCGAIAAVLTAGSAASADLVLHLDVNSIRAQATNGVGANTPFGGLNHTGAVEFSFQAGSSILAGIDIQNGNNAPVNQTVTGQLLNFTGRINMTNGMVTGGNVNVQAGGGDSYTASITPNVGAVTPFVGGGFKIEGLTFNGMFSSSHFAGVDVTPWFASQGGGGLLGSFLQFNFTPDASGFSFADVDLFVNAQVIPLPPAGWTGLATLAGLMAAGYIRRRR